MKQELDKRRMGLMLGALIVPFAVLRVWLSVTPNADFNGAGYNIHQRHRKQEEERG